MSEYEYNTSSQNTGANIDCSKSSAQEGESIQSFCNKVIARLVQIQGWFNGLKTDTVTQSSTQALTSGGAYTALAGKQNANTAVTHTASTAVGSTTQPVYVASDGTATACGTSLAVDITGNAATSSSCTGNAATSSSCTGNAATSSSCTGNAATASKLGTNAGSGTNPVYFANGVPVACGNSLAVSVTGSSASCTGNAATASSCTGRAAVATNADYATSAGSATYASKDATDLHYDLKGATIGGNNSRGFIKFSNGFIICFGYLSGGNGASQAFLTAFQSAPSVTLTHGGGRQADAGFGNCYSVSNTRITVYTTYRDSDYEVKYIACGF